MSRLAFERRVLLSSSVSHLQLQGLLRAVYTTLAAVLYQHDCVQVVCGLDHTLALSQTGVAYAFGENSLCQLGRVGNMGVQTPDTTPHDWIVYDEDHQPIHFTKVAAYGACSFGRDHCHYPW